MWYSKVARSMVIVLITTFGQAALAEPCYVGINCKRCTQAGRAYITLTVYCAVCWSFCLPNFASDGSNLTFAEKERVSTTPFDASEKILFLETRDAMIRAIAADNPEAAQMLFVMNLRSKSSPNLMPSKGHGTASRLVGYSYVMKSLAGDTISEADLNVHTFDIDAGTDDYSKVNWEFTKLPNGFGELLLSHAVFNKNDELTRKIYDDLLVKFRWVPTALGAGYWRATSWVTRK